MIRCKKCGTLNGPDATFCGQCDAFLEWSGEAVDESGAPAPAPTGRAASPPPAEAQPAAARPSAAPPAPKPSSYSTPGTTVHEPSSRKPEKGALTPARKAKPQQPTVIDKPKPGQRECPTCGTGNDPERKFCRRCGNAVGLAPIEAAPPPEPKKPRGPGWLGSIFRRGKQEAYMAGQRPESMLSSGSRWRPGSSFMVFGLLGVLGLSGLASYYYMPGVSDTVDDVVRQVQNRISGRGMVNVLEVRAQNLPDLEEAALIDGNSTSYWAAPRAQNGNWQIDFFFEEAADLVQVNIDSGAPGEDYKPVGRPKTFLLRASVADQDGGPERYELYGPFTLIDDAKQQPFEIDVPGASEIRIIVTDDYAGLDGRDTIAIRQVAFLGRQ